MSTTFSTPLQLLIIEDNPVDARLLKDLLLKSPWGSFECLQVSTLQNAIQQLERQSFDLCLLDLNLEDSYGLDTLEQLHAKFEALPIVIMSGAYTESMGLKVLTRGAQDFLLKGSCTPYILAKSLYYAIERKKNEDALRIAYEELKQTQAQLIESEKSHVIGTIATGVAHEVKNPLATIIYGIEYLFTAVKTADEKIEHTLLCIKDAAYRANDIIHDLLEFGNETPLRFEQVDITAVIEPALNLVQPQCDQKHVQIKTLLAENLPKVEIDTRRVEQVLINVLLNAVNAVPLRGEMVIETHCVKLSTAEIKKYREIGVENVLAKPMLMINVADNGPGLQPGDLEKAFDPFFTTRRGNGGVGLGLSISRMIMRQHNGFIVLENQPDGGCRVRLGFTTEKSRGEV